GATTTPWFDYWLATPDELAAAVAKSAWTLEALKRDPAGPGYIARLRCGRRKWRTLSTGCGGDG
ncbi:hypothetical protein AB0392_04820, partial [Nonomuraea angiospora]